MRPPQDPKKDLHACEFCGGLLDVLYEFDAFDPEHMRRTWHQRRLSGEPIDRSGLWRFRELLPFRRPHFSAHHFAFRRLDAAGGNAPHRLVGGTGAPDDQASGQQSHRLVQGSRHVRLHHSRRSARGTHRGVRVDGQYFVVDGRLRQRAPGIKALLFVPYKQISAAKLAQALDFGAMVVEVGR